MIIPTYSEDEILRELIFDYKIVKRMAKKIAIAYLNKNKKRGGFIQETEYDSYTITTISKTNGMLKLNMTRQRKSPGCFVRAAKLKVKRKQKTTTLLED